MSTATKHSRKRWAWVVVTVVAIAAAGTAYGVLGAGAADDDPADSSQSTATAAVSRGTIAATEVFSGTLGHGEPIVVTAGGGDADAISGSGMVTWVASPGDSIKRNSELYRVDEEPVIALIGEIPMYRDLAAGDSGRDVEQLERNLSALGYDGFTVDDEYTSYTGYAVSDWQEDHGLEATGVASADQVVFIPAAGSVESLHLGVGDRASDGTAVLSITGSEDIVSLEVDVADRDLVTPGSEVSVELADGTEVSGKITRADVVAATTGNEATGETSASAEDSVTEVEVTLTKQVDDGLSGSPADVIVAIDSREDVLLVPVNALLALAEGGYGLEVIADDGATSIVAVETGLFADGTVEITGGDVAEGTVVSTAGR